MKQPAAPPSQNDPMVFRLGFLITPRDTVAAMLRGPSSPYDKYCDTTVVVTPALHYGTHFEGWKRSWREKAKTEFLTKFVEAWKDATDDLGELARTIQASGYSLAVSTGIGSCNRARMSLRLIRTGGQLQTDKFSHYLLNGPRL